MPLPFFWNQQRHYPKNWIDISWVSERYFRQVCVGAAVFHPGILRKKKIMREIPIHFFAILGTAAILAVWG